MLRPCEEIARGLGLSVGAAGTRLHEACHGAPVDEAFVLLMRYYLTHKAQAIGYHPEIILAGRRLDDMGAHVVAQLVKAMTKKRSRSNAPRCWSWA